MKKSIMTVLIVFSILALVSGVAFAGGESSHSAMGKIKSMMGESTVFHQPQRLSKLLGSEAVNNKGEKLGKIRDLIANEDGQISYIVLSKRNLLGMVSKLVAIPISTAKPRLTKNGKWDINISKHTLDQAPTFTAFNYPDFSNKQWQDKVRGYFENKAESIPSSKEKMIPSSSEKSPKPMKSGGYGY